jgi:hypothetical protein
MSDKDDRQEEAPSRRGEAAWKAEKERVAESNARVRKAGREQREAYERQQTEGRRAAEARQMADLLGKNKAR